MRTKYQPALVIAASMLRGFAANGLNGLKRRLFPLALNKSSSGRRDPTNIKS